MDARFTYVYLPVTDLVAARTFYRDQLGLEEHWREGDTTCAFVLPGSSVKLMLDQRDPVDPAAAGLIFTVDSVEQVYEKQQGQITFTDEPRSIPGDGRWLAAVDGYGNGLYFANVE